MIYTNKLWSNRCFIWCNRLLWKARDAKVCASREKAV